MRPGVGADEALGIICIVAGVVLLVVYTIRIFYCLTMQKALSRVAPEHRTMEPGMVWLYLIPCLDIIWLFMIAIRVPESLGNEFRARGRDDGSDYGKGIGITSAVVMLLSGVVSYGISAATGGAGPGAGAGGGGGAGDIGGCLSGILSLIGLVLFIVFWVKVANYSGQLASSDSYPDEFRRRMDRLDDDRDNPYGGPTGPSPDTYKPDDGGKYQ